MEHKVHEAYTKNTTLCSSWFVVFVVLPFPPFKNE